MDPGKLVGRLGIEPGTNGLKDLAFNKVFPDHMVSALGRLRSQVTWRNHFDQVPLGSRKRSCARL